MAQCISGDADMGRVRDTHVRRHCLVLSGPVLLLLVALRPHGNDLGGTLQGRLQDMQGDANWITNDFEP